MSDMLTRFYLTQIDLVLSIFLPHSNVNKSFACFISFLWFYFCFCWFCCETSKKTNIIIPLEVSFQKLYSNNYEEYFLYNAYERTEKQDTITESVITEADISLTVTDDYIALDYAKKNFAMYLSAACEEMTKEYLYYIYMESGINESLITPRLPGKVQWY